MAKNNKLSWFAGCVLATALPASAATIYEEDFTSSDGGYTVENTQGAPSASFSPWGYDSGSGTWQADGAEGGDSSGATSILISSLISVTSSGETILSFTHRYSFEEGWDGGVLEVSINGATPTYVTLASFLTNGYNLNDPEGLFTISEYMDADVFNGDSDGYSSGEYITSTVDLGDLTSGDTVEIRWVALWDNFATGTVPNWEITSVSLTQVPEPSVGLLGMAAGASALVGRRRRKLA
ncbi:PEP-CTERM sorting domain-containing protein [Luteolibacter pohnpeiensis]|uniref:PEP-CTERM sorting domain-containing protein n=1 Tax=Luteolibacter pohnpeiensis TaxID=454153 RepID=A0A934VWP9_9BACT|nr:PEP-CTERM sorting domain-containing protein [Luteolibacter pohnpeiensis]MBK1882739.1 PEP-CTERM sorting domain-containing protein [Luteolibacter pohnpeiensis]